MSNKAFTLSAANFHTLFIPAKEDVMADEQETIAFSVREDAKANNFSATEASTALTLQGHQPSPQSHHAQLFITQSHEVMPTLTAANNPSRSPQSTEVTAQVEVMQRVTNVVRRLTPTECERLQGFPDGWTSERFDEKKQEVIPQADSNRYKQMGNAVAVPVVEWIIQRLVAANKELTSNDDNATPQPKTESRER
jgi:site-specific DNA-cytosine methylase